MRFPAAVATLFGAFLICTATADADLSFELSQSQARFGEPVHFSISGTEGRTTYSLEIGDEEVAEGSGDEDGISGQFTMPNLGGTSRTVTVEARVTQSEETVVRTRRLQYLAPTPTATGPTGNQPAPAGPAASIVHQAPASTPTPHSQRSKRKASSPKARNRRARRSPRRRQRSENQRRATRREGLRGRGRRTRARTSRNRARARAVAPPSAEDATPPSSPGTGDHTAGSKVESRSEHGSNPLAALRVPAFLSPTVAVSASDGSSFPITALLTTMLLGLAALAVAGVPSAPGWRSAAVRGQETEDDEILRGVVHVPGSGGASELEG